MAFILIPKERYKNIYQMDPQALYTRGIRLLLLDLDNTIAPYGSKGPTPQLVDWIGKLQAAGVLPFILSNSRKPTRVQEFARALGIPFLRRAGKPKKAGFLAALQQMKVEKEQAAMVGDQIFTDILGANRTGIYSILVNPLRMDTIFRLLRYGLETPFRLPADRGNCASEPVEESASWEK